MLIVNGIENAARWMQFVSVAKPDRISNEVMHESTAQEPKKSRELHCATRVRV